MINENDNNFDKFHFSHFYVYLTRGKSFQVCSNDESKLNLSQFFIKQNHRRFQSTLISNKNLNRTNFTSYFPPSFNEIERRRKEYKLSRTKKKKGFKETTNMFTDIDNRASLIKFSLVTFSTNENSCSYTYVTGIHVKKKIISANDRDKLNPDPGCK